MPLAKNRNDVPRVLLLPPTNITEKHFVHEVFAYEDDEFKLQEKTFELESYSSYWSFSYIFEFEEVRIFFTYDLDTHGMPSRNYFRREKLLFKLEKGQVGSFWLNGRFWDNRGTWAYTQNCINMAYVDHFEPNLFIANKPNCFVDRLANLF